MAGYHAERLGYLVQQWKCEAPNIDIQPTKKEEVAIRETNNHKIRDSLFVHLVN